MKAIEIGSITAVFGEEEWTSNEPFFTKFLNQRTDQIVSELGPADGDPRTIAFYRIANSIKGAKITDTDPPALSHPNNVTP